MLREIVGIAVVRSFLACLSLGTVVLFLAPLNAQPPTADLTPLANSAKAIYKDLDQFTLPNGLRVCILPVPSSPVVTTMMTYKVGSCDEDKDQTGLSHYLEHLMFKGTDKLLPGDVDRLTQRNGGANNAYTSEDVTAYHFDFAADRWEAALNIEADRMRNVRIDAKHEFEQEKGAVISELKGNEDRPWDLEYKAALATLYPKAHPYSHPVIGEESHVRGATAEIIKRYYDKWYYPNNAVLVIVGGIDGKKAHAKVEELFGSIPRGDLPKRKESTPIPARTEIVRKDLVSKFDVPRMILGFNAVQTHDADEPVFEVIDAILSEGKTSRLYQKLVEGEQLANDVGTLTSIGRYPGWFGVQLEAFDVKDRTKIESLVFAELKRLADEPVSAAELLRVNRSALAGRIFAAESVHSLADNLATAATYGEANDVIRDIDLRLAVTPADIQRVAKKYLNQNSAIIVWSLPKTENKKAGAADTEKALPAILVPRKLQRKPEQTAVTAGAGPGAVSLAAAKRVVLHNGLTLLMLENRRLPIVVASVSIAKVRLQEPASQAGIAALMGSMLDEGTPTRTGQRIAELIENTGGSMSLGSTGGTVEVLAPDTELGLNLLFDCLIHPAYPAESLERKREQLLANIADSETQPNYRANIAFQNAIYGDHPYGRASSGSKEIVAKLTAADLKAFHEKTFAPNRATIVVVGDFETHSMVKTITTLTADWKPTPDELKLPANPLKATKLRELIITDPTASQTHVYIGHLGITRNNPDYYKLLVMDYVLGTGPGFTDRLSATLRDRQGLAYTVRATITNTASELPGTFNGYIGTFADKYLTVRDGFMMEVRKIRELPATEQEVEDAKKYLLGNLAFRLTTNSQIAGELLSAERYGLGSDSLEKFRAGVASVTVADVQIAAKTYLDPNAMAIIAVGPIDSEGKPLIVAGKKDKAKKE